MSQPNRTVKQLKDECRRQGIRGYSGKNKQALIGLLEGGQPKKISTATDHTVGRDKDCYYTMSAVSEQCIQYLLTVKPDLSINTMLEPSVGSGSFIDALQSTGIATGPIHTCDINPYDADEKVEFTQANFLTNFELPKTVQRENVVTIGNPPFGKNSHLAVKFFNRAAKLSHLIGMILPRTFRKNSTIKRLDPEFHLVLDRLLDPQSFVTPDGTKKSVPCVWQVWVHKDSTGLAETINFERHQNRPPVKDRPASSNIVKFPRSWPDKGQCDIMIQRVGEAAGRMTTDRERINQRIRIKSRNFYYINLEGVEIGQLAGFSMENIPEKKNTASTMCSITKADIVHYIHQYLGS